MWQQIVDDTGLDLVSIAVDVQGPDVVRPWTTAAGTTFRTFVDTDVKLAELLGLSMVPLVLIVEDGRLATPPHRVDVLRTDNFEAVSRWARRDTDELDLPAMPIADASRPRDEALAWMALAQRALADGRRDAASSHLERAFALDPENWLITKQRWALTAPERFYDGDIDFDWQARQREAGR